MASDSRGRLIPGGGLAGLDGLRGDAPGHSPHAESAAAGPAFRARDEAARGDVSYLGGDFRKAVNHFREAVRLQPANADYRYRLACAAWNAGEMQWVMPNCLEAIRLNPRLAAAHEAMGQWALQAGDVQAALHHSAAALALSPGDPVAIVSRIFVLIGDGQTQAAWQLLEPLIASGYATEQVATAYALLAPNVGHESQAMALIERLLGQHGRSPSARPDLHFAAATLLDGVGRYDKAFAQARQANELARRPFDAAANAALFSRHINYFTQQQLRSLPRATHGNGRPVLIVGMPRSGTSLVEQILASHPDVFGAGELASLHDVARSITAAGRSHGIGMPACLDLLSLQQANLAAAEYLGTITSLNATARYVTDKMPSNFLYLGLVEVLLPDCHVIHCVRDPRDTCLSCYLTFFAGGNTYSSDLGNLAAAYRDYRRLMDHWKQVLTLPILEVRYEDVVADKEGQTRRMLEFLGLPWDERCLRFHENKRHVVTASRDQVRKPIYASSVGRWKHYEKHIPELLALVPEGT